MLVVVRQHFSERFEDVEYVVLIVWNVHLVVKMLFPLALALVVVDDRSRLQVFQRVVEGDEVPG